MKESFSGEGDGQSYAIRIARYNAKRYVERKVRKLAAKLAKLNPLDRPGAWTRLANRPPVAQLARVYVIQAMVRDFLVRDLSAPEFRPKQQYKLKDRTPLPPGWWNKRKPFTPRVGHWGRLYKVTKRKPRGPRNRPTAAQLRNGAPMIDHRQHHLRKLTGARLGRPPKPKPPAESTTTPVQESAATPAGESQE
jgi:hypothetical protein